jgi:hypothetical protein
MYRRGQARNGRFSGIGMSDLWSALIALTVIVAPLWLAWALLGWSERRKQPGALLRGRSRR